MKGVLFINSIYLIVIVEFKLGSQGGLDGQIPPKFIYTNCFTEYQKHAYSFAH